MDANDPRLEKYLALPLGVPAAGDDVADALAPVVVAVVDTGVADNHEDLQPWLLSASTVIIGDTRDDDDHGTLIAGTICSIINNAREIAGAVTVRILPVKFCSQHVPPSPNYAAKAINEAVRRGADVIVLPWDVGYSTDELRTALEHAGTADAVVVVAAGNDSLDNDKYPNWPANHGDLPHVITVMATDEKGERASFSNFGRTTVHIAAPGVDIVSTVPYARDSTGAAAHGAGYPSYCPGYQLYRGTSASAAFVAALAALIRAKNPTWTPREIKDYLRATAKPVDGLKRFCVAGGIADYH